MPFCNNYLKIIFYKPSQPHTLSTYLLTAIPNGKTLMQNGVFVGISQRLASYQAKTAFVVTGAADKVLKRWALPVHTLAASGLSESTTYV